MLVTVAALAGCGGGADVPPGDPDAGSGGGADAAGCNLEVPSPAWLEAYQSEVIERLSGAAEIADGTSLPDRATAASRELVRQYLEGELASAGLEPRRHDYGSGQNVYALLPATEEAGGAVQLWGAHFDSVPESPGANDNATGVAVVLAAARFATELPCRRSDLAFAFFDEEELGLVGSDAFAEDAAAGALGWSIAAAHSVDQVGWDGDGDRRVELERPSDELAALYAAAAPAAGVEVVVTDTGGTDHVSFRSRGIAAVGVSEEFSGGDTTPHYHQPTDVAGTVDAEYLAAVTALVFEVLVAVAD